MKIVIADKSHSIYAELICETIAEAAKVRGTGIAKRQPEYIITKMENGNAVIALEGDQFAGFCYIEAWSHGKFVANSGLIVHPDFRNLGLAKQIKKVIFNHSRTKFPESKVFSITTGLAVMKMNSELGYKPVTFSELTDDQSFWKGCQTCKNFDVLTRTEQKMCLCTGMLYDPAKAEIPKPQEHIKERAYDKKVWTRLKLIKQNMFLKKDNKDEASN
ncbi:GNAT family N-acetyltransferase [Winogradskyella costae]|uniref:GNAT family N-acetyltransferase n=1 Tax=Winogradskyella costae TaxID=2697008 RepID=UPI0015CA2B01|nr:GNAT family N-acetyltransferase [Winogradskyella costae]